MRQRSYPCLAPRPRRAARAAIVATAIVPLSYLGCANLSPYPTDECGNSVVDEARGEQCDSHVEAGQACGAPGTSVQCRYTCGVIDAAVDAASRFACPDGFACGIDDVCHRPDGSFRLTATDNSFSLGSRLGDFDGNGTDDVLTSGLSRLDVSAYGSDGVLASRQSLGGGLPVPPEVGELDVVDASAEGYDDAVYAKSGNVVVALGTAQGLAPKSYAGIRLDVKPPVFFFSVPRAIAPLLDLDATLVLAEGPDFQLELLNGDQVVPIMSWPFPGKSPSSAVTADFDPSSSCNEVVLAYDSFLASWSPCPNGDYFGGSDLGGDPVPPRRLDLEDFSGTGKRRLAGRPALIHLDLDEAYDLAVEVNECADTQPEACAFFEDEVSDCCHLYVAWGMTKEQPGGDPADPPLLVPTGRFSSGQNNLGEPDQLGRFSDALAAGVGDEAVAVHPIGWGDFNGDGLGDLVTQNAAYVGDPEKELTFTPAAFNVGLPWLDAVIADFDGDGLDDIVATPFLTPALTYLRGNRGSTMTYATIQVERPYSKVLGGDLDGDGRRDILGLTRSIDGTRDELAVHYFSDGSFAAPRSIGSFPVNLNDPDDPLDDTSTILQLGIGKIATALDSIDDLAAITTYADASGGEPRVGIALFEGSADRQLTAPIVVTRTVGKGKAATEESVNVGDVTFGHFEGGLPSIIAESFVIDLDANLEIVGQPYPIKALEPDAIAKTFPDGLTQRPDLPLLGVGNWDDDADDELVFVAPACIASDCPEGTEGAGSKELLCCAEGSEETRFFLLDRANDAFDLAAVAPTPLAISGQAARRYIGERGFRQGRLAMVDLDEDGISEALLLVVDHVREVPVTRAVLVYRRGGGLAVTEIPRELMVNGALRTTNVYGFAPTHDSEGRPLLLIGAREGLYQVPVTIGSDDQGPTFTFGDPAYVLDVTGRPLTEQEVTSVETGDVSGDGIDDLVLTRPFSTELYLGGESFEPPEGTP